MVNSDTEILTGSANFNTLAMALIEKSASKTIEADLACLFRPVSYTHLRAHETDS